MFESALLSIVPCYRSCWTFALLVNVLIWFMWQAVQRGTVIQSIEEFPASLSCSPTGCMSQDAIYHCRNDLWAIFFSNLLHRMHEEQWTWENSPFISPRNILQIENGNWYACSRAKERCSHGGCWQFAMGIILDAPKLEFEQIFKWLASSFQFSLLTTSLIITFNKLIENSASKSTLAVRSTS